MASSLCTRCLRRSLLSIDNPVTIDISRGAAFSTTSSLLATPQAAKKKTVQAQQTERGGRRLHLKKNVRTTSGRPPAPGERKAVRKRIVLSNTNALEVKGLENLTGDKLVSLPGQNVSLSGYEGHVLGFTDDTVDALRALEAFKPTQGWSLFRRPSSLVRKETLDLAKEMSRIGEDGKETVRRAIFGEKGSGKSALLLQAHAMAFLEGWIVVHFPEAQDITNAQTAYQPLNTPDGIVYVQPHYTAKLLSNLANANQSLLSTIRLSKQHELPIPIQPNMSLARFAELGARDPELAWPIWQALWSELTAQSSADPEDGLQRPPVLVTMDGVDQTMRTSAYSDADAKAIHAHDLTLVGHFMDLLSGQTSLTNGGMVLAATCQSNRATSPTLDYSLKLAHAQQHNSALEAGETSQSSTDSSAIALPEWDPYVVKDAKVESAMKGVQALKLQGLGKEEARGVMEYYAQSGILRATVTDGLVSEKWTLAGSGIIGQLEKAAVRMRF